MFLPIVYKPSHFTGTKKNNFVLHRSLNEVIVQFREAIHRNWTGCEKQYCVTHSVLSDNSTNPLNRLWLIRCTYFQKCSTSPTDKGFIQLLIFSFNRVLAKNNTKWSLCKATHLLSFRENDPLVKFCQPLQKVCGLFYQPWDLTSWSHCDSPLTDWPRPQVAQDLEYLYTQKCSTDKGEWSRGNAATGGPRHGLNYCSDGTHGRWAKLTRLLRWASAATHR